MTRPRCALAAALAVLLVCCWTAAKIRFACQGNGTAVFCTGKVFAVPPELETGTYRVEGAGYDGQFYRYLAHDPFFSKGYAAKYIDAPRMRSRRILVPFTAYLVGVGQTNWIDISFFVVEMLFLFLGVYWTARLLVGRGRSPWWGLLFVLTPGALASFDRMLVDGALSALFVGFLLYAEEVRPHRLWVVAMLAALTRETGVFLCAALVIDRLLRADWRKALWFAGCAAPAAGWFSFVAMRLPPDSPTSFFDIPIWSIVRRLFLFRTYPNPNVQLLIRVTDFLAVVGLLASIALAVWWLRGRPRGPVSICVGLFVALTAIFSAPEQIFEPFGFGRVNSPLLLCVMIEAVTRRVWAALAPPLLISLSVALTFASPLIQIWKVLTAFRNQ